MESTTPQADSSESVAVPDPTRNARVALWVGAAASLVAIAAFAARFQPPILVLSINLGLAAGAYGLLLLLEPRLRQAQDAAILQFLGFLAIALLGRVWLAQTAQGLAILFEYSLSLGALAIGAACVVFRTACTRWPAPRAALTSGVIGAAAFAIFSLALLATSSARRMENLLLLGLTCAIVLGLLGIQWFAARRIPWGPAKAWATAPALAVAGTQLFDGVLTYLVIGDPLAIAPAGYEEQIPVSRIILDYFGVAFPVAKWALGLLIAQILAQARFASAAHRVAFYLAVLAAGAGPGLFSASQLF